MITGFSAAAQQLEEKQNKVQMIVDGIDENQEELELDDYLMTDQTEKPIKRDYFNKTPEKPRSSLISNSSGLGATSFSSE